MSRFFTGRCPLRASHLGSILLLTVILTATVLLTACSSPSAAVQPPAATDAANAAAPTEPPAASPTVAPTATTEPTATQTPIPPTETPVPTPTLGIGSTRVSEIDGMEQVFVPAGEFLMGAADKEAKLTEAGGRAYTEIPQHKVTLEDYWIDKFEVTNKQYQACVAAGACTNPWTTSSNTVEKYYGNPEYDNYPVVWVTWFQAREYCGWAGRRLPNEAEWEKASRGTDGAMYPWGNDPVTGERANFCDKNCTRSIANDKFDDGYRDTAPVGSYPAGASPYGAMDMSGNVWEWTSSLIQPYPYDPNDGREDLDAPGERAWRGGPFSNGVWWMRSSTRYRSVNFYKWYVLGIRCAASE